MKGILVFALVICSAVAIPSGVHSVAIRQRRDVDILGNTRQLIEQLVENLRKAAAQAMEAVRDFESGLIEQGKLVREKIEEELKKLQELVSGSIQGVIDKITGSGAAVRACVTSKRADADSLFNDTVAKTLECADDRIGEIGIQIEYLKNNTNSAITFANQALEEMKTCVSDSTGGIMQVGMCLGTVAVRTEMKGIAYASQSGLTSRLVSTTMKPAHNTYIEKRSRVEAINWTLFCDMAHKIHVPTRWTFDMVRTAGNRQMQLASEQFLWKSLEIARLNLGLATVPAALEVCAGNHVMSAGIVTARILMEIGSCSASSVINTFTGNDV